MRRIAEKINRKTNALIIKAGTAAYAARSRKGMELVQVGILIAIAVVVGLIFKNQITAFINATFKALTDAEFNK